MEMKSVDLISDLIERTRNILNQAEELRPLSDEELNWKPQPESWSILECLEHLNRYGDFYLAEIDRRMSQSALPASLYFKSGWLGNYFAQAMLPKEKLNKMKTFKSMNPLGSRLDKEVLTTFIDQQKIMLKLLTKARNHNLTKVKTGITLTAMIKLRLGDTFRVVIYHNQRHLEQVQRLVEGMPGDLICKKSFVQT